MKKNTSSLALAVACAFGGSAFAGPIAYQGTLLDGVTVTGSISASSTLDDPEFAHFWSFSGTAGSSVTITGRRLEGGLDPAFHVYTGVFADTIEFGTGGLFDPLNGSYLTTADDELPPFVPGPYGDPDWTFTLPLPGTGVYTVAMVSFLSEVPPTPDEYWDYNLKAVVNSVPDGGTSVGLLGLAVLGLSGLRRRV